MHALRACIRLRGKDVLKHNTFTAAREKAGVNIDKPLSWVYEEHPLLKALSKCASREGLACLDVN
jgi:hypothetical protein